MSAVWESNYAVNFRFSKFDDINNHNTPNNKWDDLLPITSSHTQETMLYIDGYNNLRRLMSSEANTLNLYNRGNTKSIARHSGGANLSYIDGHVGSANGPYLLSQNNHLYTVIP